MAVPKPNVLLAEPTPARGLGAFELRPLALIHGFDKVDLWVSRPVDESMLDELSAHCDSPIVAMDVRQRYNPLYRQKLSLVAPALSIRRALSRTLGSDVQLMPTYVELATDIIFETTAQAQAALPHFLSAARFTHVRTNPLRHRDTYYLASFAGDSGRRVGVRPAIYADRPSKLASKYKGHAALHFENRISGTAVLARAGISSWPDLLGFDHDAYWKRRLRMHEVPSLTRLGRILSGRRHRDVTDKTLRHRANAFRREVIEQTVVTKGTPPAEYLFQLAAHLRPGLARALPYVGIYQWVDALRT